MPRRLKNNNRPSLDRNSRIVNTQQLLSLLGLFCLLLYNGYINIHNDTNKVQQFVAKQLKAKQSKPKTKIPFCDRRQITNGRWIQTHNDTFPTWANDLMRTVDGREISPRKADMCGRVHANDTYKWEPNDAQSETCEFVEWDATRFCELVKGAPIMMLGDSLTAEHYETFVNAFGVPTSARITRNRYRGVTFVQSICGEHLHENNNTVAMYHRLDSLDHQTVDQLLKEYFPVILIMNRGAHYTEDDALRNDLEQTFRVVQQWQNNCKLQYGIKCHFFWRTTVPGHPNCRDHHAPLHNLSQAEELLITESGNSYHSYHWQNFQHQNQLVLSMLSLLATPTLSFPDHHQQQQITNASQPIAATPPTALAPLETTILDAYYINVLRPDQHRNPTASKPDCLHSCIPGKVSIYNRLLLHWLMQSRIRQDMELLENFQFPWNRTSNVLSDGLTVVLPDGRQIIP